MAIKMKITLLSIITFILVGCATTHNERHSNRNQVLIEQHFSNTSKNEADRYATNYCGKYGATPVLKDFSKGCMFVCGGEFNKYLYDCVSNQQIAQKNQIQQKKQSEIDSETCSSWGFKKGTDKFGECMLRLYEVRSSVAIAAKNNAEIRNMTEQQRRVAETQEAYNLLELSNRALQGTQPQRQQPTQITPFRCNKVGGIVNCF
jgi:hypothetical protein